MRSHSLNVLGIEVSFKAEADSKRIEDARILLEKRFNKLKVHRPGLSKEKLLIFLALALADDYLVLEKDFKNSTVKVSELLDKIEHSMANVLE